MIHRLLSMRWSVPYLVGGREQGSGKAPQASHQQSLYSKHHMVKINCSRSMNCRKNTALHSTHILPSAWHQQHVKLEVQPGCTRIVEKLQQASVVANMQSKHVAFSLCCQPTLQFNLHLCNHSAIYAVLHQCIHYAVMHYVFICQSCFTQ